MTKQNYEVRSPIEHDGKHYAVGKMIGLSDEEATPLVNAGAVHEAIMQEPTTTAPVVETLADAAPVDVVVDAAPVPAAVDAQAEADPTVVDINAGKKPGGKKK